MNWNKVIIVVAFVIVPAIDAIAASNNLPTFDSQAAAQRHCPSDIVVWANTATDIYHFSGTRWYGRTRNGAFVCQKEAQEAGMKPARNSQ